MYSEREYSEGEATVELVEPNWSKRIESERKTAVLEERRRFAHELHDVVATELHAASLHLVEARHALKPSDARALHFIEAAAQHILNCWTDARRSAADLRPNSLERRG